MSIERDGQFEFFIRCGQKLQISLLSNWDSQRLYQVVERAFGSILSLSSGISSPSQTHLSGGLLEIYSTHHSLSKEPVISESTF